jgi:hypothetical protein
MFVGFDRGDRFTQMERDLGRPLDWVVTMLDRRSPSAMKSSAWGQFASSNAYLPKVSGRVDVVVTVPLAFGAGGLSESEIRANLQATASGRFDNDFRAIAQYVKQAGYGDAVIRLGHEMDDAWPPWSARNNASHYIAAFRHVHDVLSAESSAFRFDWASTRAGFSTWGLPSYPGDAYVDVIGLDIYWRDAAIPDRDWTNRYEPVLRQHLEFAKSRNKPVSFPEWGQAFHNTGKYIELMHGWFRSLPTTGPGRLLYQAYFNDSSQSGYDLNNYPTTKQAYIKTFKNWGLGTATPAPITTSPPTTAPKAPAPTTTTLAPATRVDQTSPSTAPLVTTAPKPGTNAPGSVFSAGSATEASLRLTWVDDGLRAEWAHPTAKLYNVRYQQTGTTGWRWLGTVGASMTSTTFDLDPSRSYTVEVISYVHPAWRTWNSATIPAQSTTPATPPATPPATAPATTPSTTAAPSPTAPLVTTAPKAGTNAPGSVFSAGSATEASLRLTWVDDGLRAEWAHPTAKLYNVRYQQTGTTGWRWLGTVGASMTSTTFDLDPSRSYTVEVISYVHPAWRTWNSATIPAQPTTTATPPATQPRRQRRRRRPPGRCSRPGPRARPRCG